MASLRPNAISQIGRSLQQSPQGPAAQPRIYKGTAQLEGTAKAGNRLLGLLAALALLLAGTVAGLATTTLQAGYPQQAGEAETLSATVSSLEHDQSSLAAQATALKWGVAAASIAERSKQVELNSIEAKIAHEQAEAGVAALHGEGITAIFNDSTDAAPKPSEDPANYILHDYDLRDIVNALWAAGAEAISINGQRITARTSVYCVGSTILIGTTRVSPPYVVSAIGDAGGLTSALKNSSQMEKFRQRALVYDLPIQITGSSDIVTPAEDEPAYRYAHVAK